ncbi:putative toxin-antitoxin system toxin component, PIN family [Ottowia testudinis]|uniref:Toxin-antitoxin system toxin component, PIN family n=1 Tax=Ottowia testudinis TaxID=2816950 RepID=A0A975CDD2_9BURK|nr:putative toxin-antitoxin system toxin component, PIN family [Ottowia testudinis]QTD43797.1 putative toxin-antitoxin system toxin component, PIN family [Ottowia testudinis]
MLFVLDTNVLVAALRSPAGLSAELLRRALQGRVSVACSVPLFMEYEAVLLRPEQLEAAGLDDKAVINVLDVLAGVVKPVDIHYLWRPQLRDAEDDMVLELAVNAQRLAQPVAIVTFNQRDFLPQAERFGVAVLSPRKMIQGD